MQKLSSQHYSEAETQALKTWVKLSRAQAIVSKHALAHIRSVNLTPTQFAVVECLGHLGAMTLGALSSKMLMSCGNITMVVHNLEKDGWIARERSPLDRRVVHVELTPEGYRRFEKIFPSHAAHICELFSVLHTKEQKELSRLLKKLGLSLRDLDATPP